MRRIKRYGWKPDLGDHRDLHYHLTVKPMEPVPIPDQVDLRPDMPEVEDQGSLGSCTANAVVGLLEYNRNRQGLPFTWLSRLFAYYNGRAVEDSVGEDGGAMLRDVVKCLFSLGICPEDMWPYAIDKFADKPPVEAYAAAQENKIRVYARVTGLDDMLHCLAAGHPFVFGFTVYDSFESDLMARTGELNMPGADEVPCGGHAVLAVGFSKATSRILVRNSWGPTWGQEGYFTMPFDYISNPDLADDHWTIRV